MEVAQPVAPNGTGHSSSNAVVDENVKALKSRIVKISKLREVFDKKEQALASSLNETAPKQDMRQYEAEMETLKAALSEQKRITKQAQQQHLESQERSKQAEETARHLTLKIKATEMLNHQLEETVKLNEVSKIELTGAKNDIKKLTTKVQTKQQDLTAAKAELAKLRSEIQEKEEASLEREKLLEGRNRDLQAQIADLESQNAELQSQLDDTDFLAPELLKQNVEDVEKELGEARKTVDLLEARVTAANKENINLKEELRIARIQLSAPTPAPLPPLPPPPIASSPPTSNHLASLNDIPRGSFESMLQSMDAIKMQLSIMQSTQGAKNDSDRIDMLQQQVMTLIKEKQMLADTLVARTVDTSASNPTKVKLRTNKKATTAPTVSAPTSLDTIPSTAISAPQSKGRKRKANAVTSEIAIADPAPSVPCEQDGPLASSEGSKFEPQPKKRATNTQKTVTDSHDPDDFEEFEMIGDATDEEEAIVMGSSRTPSSRYGVQPSSMTCLSASPPSTPLSVKRVSLKTKIPTAAVMEQESSVGATRLPKSPAKAESSIVPHGTIISLSDCDPLPLFAPFVAKPSAPKTTKAKPKSTRAAPKPKVTTEDFANLRIRNISTNPFIPEPSDSLNYFSFIMDSSLAQDKKRNAKLDTVSALLPEKLQIVFRAVANKTRSLVEHVAMHRGELVLAKDSVGSVEVEGSEPISMPKAVSISENYIIQFLILLDRRLPQMHILSDWILYSSKVIHRSATLSQEKLDETSVLIRTITAVCRIKREYGPLSALCYDIMHRFQDAKTCLVLFEAIASVWPAFLMSFQDVEIGEEKSTFRPPRNLVIMALQAILATFQESLKHEKLTYGYHTFVKKCRWPLVENAPFANELTEELVTMVRTEDFKDRDSDVVFNLQKALEMLLIQTYDWTDAYNEVLQPQLLPMMLRMDHFHFAIPLVVNVTLGHYPKDCTTGSTRGSSDEIMRQLLEEIFEAALGVENQCHLARGLIILAKQDKSKLRKVVEWYKDPIVKEAVPKDVGEVLSHLSMAQGDI
ncbi:hypothetical protein BG004_006296 [Podila humilis]|nr:hypothetical protein BG004_006296 [Podila humilis]